MRGTLNTDWTRGEIKGKLDELIDMPHGAITPRLNRIKKLINKEIKDAKKESLKVEKALSKSMKRKPNHRWSID